ncbi:uncharacterized protein A4U43_C03F31260 [Asparagus officinalis]|uniref:Uncharacterized protein n=1 Tax=Asparagus officinalis TaxID=4686 RepID=A0A5P1FEB8_ASPOF|nr:uncharacterized protein A4U43_C03F31260 [Asparagus officinalis]
MSCEDSENAVETQFSTNTVGRMLARAVDFGLVSYKNHSLHGSMFPYIGLSIEGRRVHYSILSSNWLIFILCYFANTRVQAVMLCSSDHPAAQDKANVTPPLLSLGPLKASQQLSTFHNLKPRSTPASSSL